MYVVIFFKSHKVLVVIIVFFLILQIQILTAQSMKTVYLVQVQNEYFISSSISCQMYVVHLPIFVSSSVVDPGGMVKWFKRFA